MSARPPDPPNPPDPPPGQGGSGSAGENETAAVGTPPGSQGGAFALELFLTAGPRKDPDRYATDGAEREAGEDAAGVLCLPGACLFWIADGTSQEPALAGFSARRLARDLGACLQRAALPRLTGDLLPETLLTDIARDAFHRLQEQWGERLRDCWASLPPAQRGQFLLACADCGDGRRRLQWSSTVLFGALAFVDGTLAVANCGDSGGLVYAGAGAPAPIAPNGYRCFVALEYAPDAEQPEIVPYLPAPEVIPTTVYPTVTEFCCCSDGAAAGGLPRLLTQLADKPAAQAERLLKEARLHSGDDKALLIGKRVELPGGTAAEGGAWS
jgi:hypothetical protein